MFRYRARERMRYEGQTLDFESSASANSATQGLGRGVIRTAIKKGRGTPHETLADKGGNRRTCYDFAALLL